MDNYLSSQNNEQNSHRAEQEQDSKFSQDSRSSNLSTHSEFLGNNQLNSNHLYSNLSVNSSTVDGSLPVGVTQGNLGPNFTGTAPLQDNTGNQSLNHVVNVNSYPPLNSGNPTASVAPSNPTGTLNQTISQPVTNSPSSPSSNLNYNDVISPGNLPPRLNENPNNTFLNGTILPSYNQPADLNTWQKFRIWCNNRTVAKSWGDDVLKFLGFTVCLYTIIFTYERIIYMFFIHNGDIRNHLSTLLFVVIFILLCFLIQACKRFWAVAFCIINWCWCVFEIAYYINYYL